MLKLMKQYFLFLVLFSCGVSVVGKERGGANRFEKGRSLDTLTRSGKDVEIGPKYYELPPEKTPEQLLEEAYSQKKKEDSLMVSKGLAAKRLVLSLQQVGPLYPQGQEKIDKTEWIHSLQRSLQSYMQLDNFEMVSNLQNKIAILQVENKEYEPAIRNFQQALSIKSDLKDVNSQGIICLNLGLLFDFLNRNEQAEQCFQNMHRLALNSRNIRNEAISLEQLAILKAKEGAFKQAEQEIIKKVLPLYKRDKNQRGRIGAYNHLATIYLAEEKYTESRWFHLQAVKIASIRKENSQDMSYSLYRLGLVKKILKEFDLAIADYVLAADYANQCNDDLLRLSIYSDLGDMYLQTGDYPRAAEYLKEYRVVKNRVFSDESQRALDPKQEIAEVSP